MAIIKTPAAYMSDFTRAMGLLTRLPIPSVEHTESADNAAWTWPVVGLVIGALGAIAASVALAFGLPPTLAAVAALATTITTTGALHEDGLADSADGFWGGHSVERRLEIMRDSRIGTYGVLALGLSLLARWAALTALIGAGWVWVPLLVTGATSRAVMSVAMHLLPHARGDGLSHSTGRPDRRAMLAALGVAALATAVLAGTWLFWIALVLAIALALSIQLSRQKIGGQTGDTIGATQQIAEVVVLATFTALIS